MSAFSNRRTTASDRKTWSAEKLAAASKIEMLIEFWKIRPSELRMAVPKSVEPDPAAPDASGAPSVPKYRHPLTGETWDGIGSQPDWLKHALLKEGFRPQDVRVPEAQAAAQAEPTDETQAVKA